MSAAKVSILLLLLLGRFTPAFSQLSFDHLTISNGLSQSTVLSVCKDNTGYMWFGTRDGINRYDGREIRIYRHNDENNRSISSDDYIYAITKTRDNNLWIGTQNGVNCYHPVTDSFEQLYHSPKSTTTISGNSVLCIYQSGNGQLWFGTKNGLSMLPDTKSRNFTSFYTKDGLAGDEVYCIFEDSKKNIWIGTTSGLSKMVPHGNNQFSFLNFFSKPEASGTLSGNSIKTIAEDRQGNIWIGTEKNGITIYNPNQNSFRQLQYQSGEKNGLSNNLIRKILLARDGKLWIATMNGLNIYDPERKTFTVYKHDSENRKSLIDNSIKDIFEDEQGSFWIGTNFGGLSIAHKNAVPFEIFKHSKYRNSISNDIISVIAGIDNSHILCGTEGSGLDYMDIRNHQFVNYRNSPSDNAGIGSNTIKSIFKDNKGYVWIGLFEGGLERFNQATGSFQHFKPNPYDSSSISYGYVSSIAQDRQGRLWIGTSTKGINLYDYHKQNFTRVDSKSKGLNISNDYIRTMLGDSKGNLWVGTVYGLNVLRKGKQNFERFDKIKYGLKSDYINCILEDKHGDIWIGAHRGGLAKYLVSKNKFLIYTTKNGLPGNNVVGLAIDNDGNLWISTDRGLSKFDVKQQNFKNYYTSDGLPSNEFCYGAAYKAPDGTLYFGSYNGLVSFKPDHISINRNIPKVVFTSLRLFNNEVKVGAGDGLLNSDLSFNPKIEFNASQNVFTIQFASLNYVKPERNKYQYKLEGFENNWNEVNIPSATYTNLSPGTYHFLVKGSNNDGVWNPDPTRIEIKILPPVWKTWWAYLLYAIVFFTGWYYFNRFLKKQQNLETELYYEHLNNERQEELYQNKLEFFTKISHEIRTPLTLIFAPLEQLISYTRNDELLNKRLTGIKLNTERLLRLVGELLDFRKIDTGHLKLNLKTIDLTSYSMGIFESFKVQAMVNQIDFNFEAEENTYVKADTDQMDKVVFNILSNAFKYTGRDGKITLKIYQDNASVFLSVEDNGLGIPEEDQQKIFDNFYQSKNESGKNTGWGIGLALVKSIVDLHQGEIKLQSTPQSDRNEGYTCFTVSLKRLKANDNSTLALAHHHTPLNNEIPEHEIYNQNIDTCSTGMDYTILVVEDNEELRNFLVQSLIENYHVIEARDGKEGFHSALTQIPDIVISDVTMPVMDGFELCQKLKTNEITNHIPVVMLTAMVSHVHQVDGLQSGADIYLTKPFSIQLLQLHIQNLIKSAETLKEKYRKQVMLMPRNVEIDDPEERFVNKLILLIEEHIADTDFKVSFLVDRMGMSQTVLYKKIKAITGMNIADLIKSIRLKRAVQLLEQHKFNISEVAYAVGFNDRKYFSKEFKKQFGKAPSEYLKSD